jgi:hypothetical protein
MFRWNRGKKYRAMISSGNPENLLFWRYSVLYIAVLNRAMASNCTWTLFSGTLLKKYGVDCFQAKIEY